MADLFPVLHDTYTGASYPGTNLLYEFVVGATMASQRVGMIYYPATEITAYLGHLSIFITRIKEQVLVIVPQADINMHTRAIVKGNRFGHHCGYHVVFRSYIFDNMLITLYLHLPHLLNCHIGYRSHIDPQWLLHDDEHHRLFQNSYLEYLRIHCGNPSMCPRVS